ncbi:hypothetical protein BBJ28_00006171 [Nothophytophthora sp. Chile5]|nr:hypothetical protein BBJ28_00006171 [Nothophytophthora sp. Chile5]
MAEVHLWSGASRPDVRPNVIDANRAPADLGRVAFKQEVEPHRVALEEAEEGRRREVDSEQEAVEQERIANEAFPAADERQHLRGDAEETAELVAVTDIVAIDTTAGDAKTHSNAVPAMTAEPHRSFEERHDVVSGYEAAMSYLANYTTLEGTDEQLFLFFVCGDEQGKQTDWRPLCGDTRRVVYDVFAKSPSRNRLVTIHAGSKKDWSAPNAFFNDGDLRLKAIPSILQWHGGTPGAKRATSGMIIEGNLLYEPLLRYLFKNVDIPDPLLTPESVASKEIVLLKGYDAYRSYMDTIASGDASTLAPEGPLFLLLIAGRAASNDRLWCPYCRYSELSVEYAFYAFAPRGARLVKVETVPSYKTWKNPANDWKQDKALSVRGVPWMYHAHLDAETHSITFERSIERFDIPDALRGVFQGWRKTPV